MIQQDYDNNLKWLYYCSVAIMVHSGLSDQPYSKSVYHWGFLSCWIMIDGHVLCCVDEVEKVIGLLLRESGDKLNEEVRNKLLDHVGKSSFVKVWHLSMPKKCKMSFCLRQINIKKLGELFSNYGFFERVINTLLTRMGLISPQPDALGPQSSPKTQIAVTCEVRTAFFYHKHYA